MTERLWLCVCVTERRSVRRDRSAAGHPAGGQLAGAARQSAAGPDGGRTDLPAALEGAHRVRPQHRPGAARPQQPRLPAAGQPGQYGAWSGSTPTTPPSSSWPARSVRGLERLDPNNPAFQQLASQVSAGPGAARPQQPHLPAAGQPGQYRGLEQLDPNNPAFQQLASRVSAQRSYSTARSVRISSK